MRSSKKKIEEDDLITEHTKANYSLEEWKRTWMNRMGDNVLFISALNKDNIEDFKKKVYNTVRKIHLSRFPYNNLLYPEYEEIEEKE